MDEAFSFHIGMCPSVSLYRICVALMTLSAVTLQPGVEAFTLPSPPLVLRIGTASGSMASMASKHGSGGKRWKRGPELSRETHFQFKRAASAAKAAAGSVEEIERTERDCVQATTCIVVTRHEGDIASGVMADALLRAVKWQVHTAACGVLWRCSSSNVFLWERSESMLEMDRIDEQFMQVTNERATDFIFMSKHASAAGTPALTAGKCPPPSPRLAAMYRRLFSMTAASPLKDDFQVSLEGTHHGPWLSTPALFAEIGSTPQHWERTDAADLWAQVLSEELGLTAGSCLPTARPAACLADDACWWQPQDAASLDRPVVLVCIGGGHYAAKHGDLLRGTTGEQVFLGHILPSYTLDFAAPNAQVWQQCISEAVQSTRMAFAGGGHEIVCYIDKKAVKAPQREALVEYLEERLGLRTALKPADVFRRPNLPIAGLMGDLQL